MKRVLGGVLGLTALAVLGIAVVFTVVLPRQNPPGGERVEITPVRVERGTYLVENVLLCINCHSERDWTIYGAPAKPPFGSGRVCLGTGVEVPGLDDTRNFPGTVCFRNITPHPETGIGTWTDGEIIRAVREGIGKDGQTLFPIMPYTIYRELSDDDVRAVVAYLRTLEPVDNPLPPSEISFPVNYLLRMLPRPVDGRIDAPDPEDNVAYGGYLATIGRCAFCHTPKRNGAGAPIPGMEFAGGVPFSGPGGPQVSTNLTPHRTGLGGVSRDDFITMFKQHAEPRRVARESNTLMSWTSYAGMSERDLGVIYDFLRSVPPVDNPVELP